MHTQPPQPGVSRSECSRLAGATSNTTNIGKQQERRHQLFHHNMANVSTKHMTQNAQLKIVRKTGSSKNKKEHGVGSEFVHIEVNGHQWIIWHKSGIRKELRDQFIATRSGKPPWSSQAVVCTVCKIKHHDVISSAIVVDEFPNEHPRKWRKQVLITLEEAMEEYMAEELAKSHC